MNPSRSEAEVRAECQCHGVMLLNHGDAKSHHTALV